MSDQKLYPVKQEFADSAWINNEKYLQMYQQSIINPEGFWREQAMQRIDWMKPLPGYAMFPSMITTSISNGLKTVP